MFNSRDEITDMSAALRDERDYTVPFALGTCLVRTDNPDIIDQVDSYIINRDGILVRLLLDISNHKEEIFSGYFPADALKESHKKYSGFFVKRIDKSRCLKLGLARKLSEENNK